MPVDDLWYLSDKDDAGKRVKSSRYGRGKRYRVRYIDDAGEVRQPLFEKKPAAELFDANVRADISRGLYVDPDAGRTTVREYGEKWRANLVHRGTTAERFESAFRLHVDPILGIRHIGAVRPSHIQSWVKNRSAVLAPTTLRVVYGYLSAMFTAAVLDRAIGASPCQGIRLPDVEREDRFIPTPEQVHQLAAALPVPYRAMVYLAAGCGLRQGEAWGLEVDAVNFLRREIRVVQQLVQPSGRPPYLGPPKTATSRRTVEMGTVVGEALAYHFEVAPARAVEILDATDPRRLVRREAKLLFVNTVGDPLRRGYAWSKPWDVAIGSVPEVPDDFGYHGLRHYFATLLIHAGASVKTVQLALGHSKPSITLDMYTHEWPDALDRTRNLVDAALTGSSAMRVVG